MTCTVLVVSGYGINCETETAFAFQTAGAQATIVHINDLVAKKSRLLDFDVLAFPGGFSYGDDTGSGNAFANKIQNRLGNDLEAFVHQEKLVIGICNGFQIIANLGLLPALNTTYGTREIALEHNDSARYSDRWVDLQFEGNSPWIRGIELLSLPIAHGEGRFETKPDILTRLKQKNMICARYVKGEISDYQNLPENPNGSLENIAGITDSTGRVLGLMPHPERAVMFSHHPKWPVLKEQFKRANKPLPQFGPSLQLFQNAVEYFK